MIRRLQDTQVESGNAVYKACAPQHLLNTKPLMAVPLLQFSHPHPVLRVQVGVVIITEAWRSSCSCHFSFCPGLNLNLPGRLPKRGCKKGLIRVLSGSKVLPYRPYAAADLAVPESEFARCQLKPYGGSEFDCGFWSVTGIFKPGHAKIDDACGQH